MYHLKRNSGGATRDRTADLLRARQALSQLSYSPKFGTSMGTTLPLNQGLFLNLDFVVGKAC